MQKLFPNKLSLIVLVSACSVILISMGLRQTFGLFFEAFEKGLGVTRTEFGLAIGIQMLFWGIFAPIFGFLADKFGGNKAVFVGFLIFALGIFMLYSGYCNRHSNCCSFNRIFLVSFINKIQFSAFRLGKYSKIFYDFYCFWTSSISIFISSKNSNQFIQS